MWMAHRLERRLPTPPGRGSVGRPDGGTPLPNQHPSLASLRRIRSYEAFKAHYLQLDPELADSPAFVQELLATHGFDWLEALVEETLEPESGAGDLSQPLAA